MERLAIPWDVIGVQRHPYDVGCPHLPSVEERHDHKDKTTPPAHKATQQAHHSNNASLAASNNKGSGEVPHLTMNERQSCAGIHNMHNMHALRRA